MFIQQVQLNAADILGVSVSPGSVRITTLLASEEAANAFLALVPLGVLTVGDHLILGAPPATSDGSSGDSASASTPLHGAVIGAAVGGFMLAIVLFIVMRRRSSKEGSLSTPPAYDESASAQTLKSMLPPPAYHNAAAHHIYMQPLSEIEYEELPDGEVLYEMPADVPSQQASLSEAKQSSNVYHMASSQGSSQVNATYDVANTGEPVVYSTAMAGRGSGHTLISCAPAAEVEYDVASALPGAATQHSHTEYDVATASTVASRGYHGAVYDIGAALPELESYDNLGNNGQTLYDVIPQTTRRCEIDFGFGTEQATTEEFA